MENPKIVPDRRMGPAGSETWHAMLDGAEYILREEGHAQLTSRRIAERIGVKQRLVYYYFMTMDDLVVELFRRSSKQTIERLEQASHSKRSLREIWNTNFGTTDARLISEFMALANRIEGLKHEVIRFIEESRQIEVNAIAAALARKGAASGMTPSSLAMIAGSLALSLSREEQLGIRSGHADLMSTVEQFLSSFEG